LPSKPRTERRDWGPYSLQTWTHRPEIIDIRERGGTEKACAAALKVSRSTLNNWRTRKDDWQGFVPNALVAILHEYLSKLPKTAASAVVAPAPAAGKRPVVVVSEADARLKPDFAVLSTRFPNSPRDEGEEIALACEINVGVMPVASGLGLGIVRLRAVFERARGSLGSFAAEPEPRQPAGVKIDVGGVSDRMVATLQPSGDGALRMNGLREPPMRLGTLCESAAGSVFTVKLLAATQSDFVHVRRLGDGRDGVESVNRKKVLSHFAKWQIQIPAEAVDIEFVDQTWRVRETGER